MHTRRLHLTQDEQEQVDSGTVEEAASSGALFPVVSESLPAWQAAGIASSVGMTQQAEEDFEFGLAMGVDAASHRMLNSSATMAEILALQSSIAPTPSATRTCGRCCRSAVLRCAGRSLAARGTATSCSVCASASSPATGRWRSGWRLIVNNSYRYARYRL